MSDEDESLSPDERDELEKLRKDAEDRDRDLLGVYTIDDLSIRVVKAEFFNPKQREKNFAIGLKGFGCDTMMGAKKWLALTKYASEIEKFFLENGQVTEEQLEDVYGSDQQ